MLKQQIVHNLYSFGNLFSIIFSMEFGNWFLNIHVHINMLVTKDFLHFKRIFWSYFTLKTKFM